MSSVFKRATAAVTAILLISLTGCGNEANKTTETTAAKKNDPAMYNERGTFPIVKEKKKGVNCIGCPDAGSRPIYHRKRNAFERTDAKGRTGRVRFLFRLGRKKDFDHLRQRQQRR